MILEYLFFYVVSVKVESCFIDFKNMVILPKTTQELFSFKWWTSSNIVTKTK